jgi:DNA-binding response OmpR family regulator
MEALIVENDPLVRDQLKVALQQFPDVHIATGVGYAAVNELRSRTFDCVFLGIDATQHESVKLLQHLRALDRDTPLFVLAAGDSGRELAAEKAKFGIHALLATPLAPRELFAQLGRLFTRLAERAERAERPAPARRPARHEAIQRRR